MAIALTADLGELIAATRYEDLPAKAVEKVSLAIIDTVGVMIAGAQEPGLKLLLQMLNPGGTESMLVMGGRGSALDAAWINGTAAHALDYDDVAQQGGHASAVLVPAILAEAEALGSSGRDIALAYIVGYEVFSDLASRDLDPHHSKGWHPTSIFGALGAAAACASLRRLDAGKAAMALALSGSQAGGLMSNFGTMTKPFHAGRAAHAGVASAHLASLGFTASMDALEHAPGFLQAVSPEGRIDLDRPVPQKRALENGWALLGRNQLAVKKYPMCYCAHRTLDGTLDMRASKKITSSEVASVNVSLSPRNVSILRNHDPKTGLEAKFSIEFAIASALVAGRAGLGELRDEFVQRGDIRDLMRKVSITEDARDDPRRPGYAVNDRVVVTLRDGTVHDSGPITQVRGDPELPLKKEDLRAKFDDCVAAGGVTVDAKELFGMLSSIGTLANLNAVVGHLQGGRPG